MSVKEEKGNSMLSDAEQEKLVIKLLKENKTYRQITQIAGANPKQISNIKKNFKGIKNQPPVNIQAFKMFEEGKRPIAVAIAIEIGTEETLKYYNEYLHLKAEEDLLKARDILGKDLVPFVNIFKEMGSIFSLEIIKEAFSIAEKKEDAIATLTILEMDKERELKAVEKLIRERNELRNDISVGKHELERLELIKRSLFFFESQAQEKNHTERSLPQLFDSS